MAKLKPMNGAVRWTFDAAPEIPTPIDAEFLAAMATPWFPASDAPTCRCRPDFLLGFGIP
jgi:hypothetical protein